MQIRVAIVGFGFMGQMHAKVYQALPGVEIVGIAEAFPGAAEQAVKLGIKVPVENSLERLLKAVDCHVVDICLPTDLHATAIIAAAEAGKHVFCEKPFALELKDATRALEAVERAGISFQVGQCIRFWPEYQALEQFVRSEKEGKLRSLALQRRAGRPAYSRENWLHEVGRSKGAALDLHIHDTDYVLHLLGKPASVHSMGRGDDGTWSHIFTQYRFADVAVTSEGGWDLPPSWGFQMSFQAVFDDAVVDFDSSSSPTLYLTSGQGKKEPMPFQKPSVAPAANSGGNLSDLGGYYNELAYFCGQLAQGKKPEIATGAQALESLRVVLAEMQSVSEKREIAV
jgi:predicted dehydrogenase